MKATSKATQSIPAHTGAFVAYCGHRGGFIADVIPVGTAVVIRAAAKVTMDNLNRDQSAFENATHHIMDFPTQGFWRPDLGIFVVPQEQVRILKESAK